jgi:hypothetical protein
MEALLHGRAPARHGPDAIAWRLCPTETAMLDEFNPLPVVTVLAGEVLPVVQGEEEGDLLQWCECDAGECVVSKSNDANLQDANLTLVGELFPENIFFDLFCFV